MSAGMTCIKGCTAAYPTACWHAAIYLLRMLHFISGWHGRLYALALTTVQNIKHLIPAVQATQDVVT